jgi:hypothetical protein
MGTQSWLWTREPAELRVWASLAWCMPGGHSDSVNRFVLNRPPASRDWLWVTLRMRYVPLFCPRVPKEGERRDLVAVPSHSPARAVSPSIDVCVCVCVSLSPLSLLSLPSLLSLFSLLSSLSSLSSAVTSLLNHSAPWLLSFVLNIVSALQIPFSTYSPASPFLLRCAGFYTRWLT